MGNVHNNIILILDKDDAKFASYNHSLISKFPDTTSLLLTPDDNPDNLINQDIDIILVHDTVSKNENFIQNIINNNLYTKYSNIILINGNLDDNDESFIELLIEINASDYILEPIDYNLLANKVRLIFYHKKNNRKLRKRLSEEENNYKAIVELQTELIVKTDTEFNINFINPSVCEYFNNDKDNIIGTNFFRFIPEEKKYIVKNKLSMLSGKYPITRYEVYYEGISEFERNWVRWSTRSVYDDKDNMIEYHHIGRDITGRKMAEDIVRNSEERYKKLFTRMKNAYAYQRIIADDNGQPVDSVFIDANDAFNEQIGISKEHIVNKKASDIFKEIRNRDSSLFKSYLKAPFEGKDSEAEIYVKSLNRWLFIYSYPLYKNFFATIIENITPEKQTIQKLKESEEKYRTLFKKGKDAIFVHSINKDSIGNFIEVNETACKILGYTKEELLKLNPKDITINDDLYKREIKINNIIDKLINQGESLFEVNLLTKSGDIIPAEINSNVINIQNEFFVFSLARDINERKKTENRIREREESFKSIFDNSPVGIFIFDSEGYAKNINETARKMYGIEDIHAYKKLYNMLRDKSLSDEYKQKIMNGEVVKYERMIDFDLLRKTRPYRLSRTGKVYTEIIITPLKETNEPDSKIKNYFVQVNDITERVLAEEEIKRSEERFKNIFENSPTGIFLFDSDGVILDMNETAKNIINVNDIKVYQEYFNLLNNPFIDKEIINQLIDGETVKFISKLDFDEISDQLSIDMNKKGIIFLETIITPLKENDLSDNNINNLIVMVNDITDRRLTEQKLKRSEQRANAIIQDQTELIIRYDPNFIITFVNEAYMNYFRLSKEELIGVDLLKYFPTNHRKNFVDHVKKLSYDNPISSMEYCGVIKNWVKWQEWVHRAIFDDNNRIIEYQSVGRDITEQKRYKNMLEKALKNLKEKNEELSRFSHHISHDLKSPLNSLISYIRIIRYQYVEFMEDEELHEITESILRKTKNMMRMIEDILLYSELDNPEKGFERVDLNEVLSIVLEYLEEKIKETGAEITSNTLPKNIFAIRTYMISIFQNLISNALKYRQKNVKPVIQISSSEQEEDYLISVKDNGIGIKKQHHESIFQLFKRLSESEENINGDVTHGSGIGLSFCKKIVELHRGTIYLESEYGKGTTFFFTIRKKEFMV